MRGYRTPNAFRSNLNSSRGSKSASHGKPSSKSKVGSSSAPNLTWRKKSPKFVESQQRQISPDRIIGSSWENGTAVDPEEVCFDIQRDANVSSLNRKSEHLFPPRRNWILKSPQGVESQNMQTSSERNAYESRESNYANDFKEDFFDICNRNTYGPVKLCKPLHVLNRERRKEFRHFQNANEKQYIRPGMILLKYFLTHRDQVKVVNKCRELGISAGGFYRPGYTDGAKLHLQMMCLGKDWNPESRSYGKCRAFDGAVPPEIPEEFKKLVDGALQTSHEFLASVKEKSVDEIPMMSPDICIVNFYNNSGRLGLHQDRDESEESLRKGLPVVSFSIGDSAKFLYSDERNAEKAENVTLESGDVLIFGGKSRHIFHGVPSIQPDTAPEILISETNLCPGRLNLTFRQY